MESRTDESFVSFTAFVSMLSVSRNFYRNDFNSRTDQFDKLLLEPADYLTIAKDSNQPGPNKTMFVSVD